jgi:hypothetical protein
VRIRLALFGLIIGLMLVVAPVVPWAGGAASTPAPAALPGAPASLAPAGEPGAPVRIRAEAIGLDAVVAPVGVDDRGQMAVPGDVRIAGWYRFGPAPGAPAGSSVLSSHVDDRLQGPGAFLRLRELPVGAPIEVELADGSVQRYEVGEVEQIDKDALPTGSVFERAGAPRLTLVTCGGDFDQAAQAYRNNVVVTALPVMR